VAYLAGGLLSILSVSPAAGAKDIPTDTVITVSFSVDLNQATISVSTFRLHESDGSLVPLRVEYAKRVATLQPLVPLSPAGRYLVEIVGGDEGVKSTRDGILLDNYTWTFTTAAEAIVRPDPPVLVRPANQSLISEPNPTFIWQTVEGAVRYEMQVAQTADFRAPMLYETAVDTYFTPSTALESAIDADPFFYWRVRAIDGDGDVGPWSLVHVFSVAISAPEDYYGRLEIARVWPDPTSVGNAKTSPVHIQFNTPLDPDTVKNYTVYVRARKVI
jgi:hypothetical protein